MIDAAIMLTFIQNMIWPFIILVFLYYLKGPLKKLLLSFTQAIDDRGIKLTTTGVEIPSQQETLENSVLGIKTEKDNLLQPSALQKQQIPIEWSEDTLNIANGYFQPMITEHGSLPQEVIGSLNENYIKLNFEKIYHKLAYYHIFLLKFLHAQENNALTITQAKILLNTWTKEHGKQIDHHECVSLQLVIESGEFVRLTPIGVDCLKYFASEGYL